MALADSVHIARRFQRAIRIDTDHNDPKALEGFVCPKSSADALSSVGYHLNETGHGAFTWTGPYGSGKSSLVVALSALLSGESELVTQAERAVGKQTAKDVLSAMPPKEKGWITLPVVGRRENASYVIGEALEAQGLVKKHPKGGWSDKTIVASLEQIAARAPRLEGGLILFVDEMGKFLEAAAQEGADVYLFQLLAEAASRSDGRLVIIGILHQSFEEYASRLSRDMRDEWTKIQGRFVDLAINAAGEEQIELISRAIQNGRRVEIPGKLANLVSSEIHRQKPAASRYLSDTLERCWPLHPVVACLLGPISRRRFGQNQRSIFGFLNSAEPYGFQDFIKHEQDDALFEPDNLWDYLRVNLEPSILASPDGHRWAMAAEAIERCEALGGDALQTRLLKSIALIDLFKERSGLLPTEELLCTCVGSATKAETKAALQQLKKWSLVIFRKFADSYAIFAGSDFDIDRAVQEAMQNVREVDFTALQRLAGLQPILAKRHYHETGALRWFDVEITPLNTLIERASFYKPHAGTIGEFLLAIPTEGETAEQAERICQEAARESRDWDIVTGLSKRSWAITGYARELIALAEVQEEHPDLAGDTVAQREVQARHTVLQGLLEEEIRRASDNATWYRKNRKPQQWLHAELNNIASELAESLYPQSPRLNNELLNRIKPSSNAIAAQNTLLRAMVSNEGTERLGIEGFPAEGGLFASLLEKTGLYAVSEKGWSFRTPDADHDPSGLLCLWCATTELLKEAQDRTVSVEEIYRLWGAPPYGVKEGVMPVLVVAYILSRREDVALYREGVFQARFKDIDVEVLAKNAASIQLRWMDLSLLSRRLLSSMAEVVRDLDSTNCLTYLAPIDVARGLIAIFDRLHSWSKRTAQLSTNAIRVRELFKLANDPNKFLFDDIPAAFGGHGALDEDEALKAVVADLREGLEELVQSYPSMLRRLTDLMLAELQVPNASPQSLAELSARAENIRGIGGDFRLNAFIGRLATFDGSAADFEGIASLAANKPPRDWTDADLDRASIELLDLSQKFIRSENFARVKGRVDKRHAMAVVVAVNGRPAPAHAEFEVAEQETEIIEDIVKRVEGVLNVNGGDKTRLILAALAELSARYMAEPCLAETKQDERGIS
ncbi:ATP-binding protein [uncultured Cohaesibacter sp.]|uniref:ATP-binding protein n=1 Tax=uncultured Cohaesibacter sp. TaxID=1002546 RepID=UPI0029C65703|nr:ATP-binding protein [uncultured Cohaesibacter sp.]